MRLDDHGRDDIHSRADHVYVLHEHGWHVIDYLDGSEHELDEYVSELDSGDDEFVVYVEFDDELDAITYHFDDVHADDPDELDDRFIAAAQYAAYDFIRNHFGDRLH